MEERGTGVNCERKRGISLQQYEQAKLHRQEVTILMVSFFITHHTSVNPILWQ